MILRAVGRWLVRWSVDPADRDVVIADLDEHARGVRTERGAFAADLWYLWQGAAFLPTGVASRLRLLLGRGWSGEREGWAAATVRDALLALRGLRRAPAFTLAAVATLAVGIGGVTAVFGVVEGVLLRPLPFPDPERLVAIDDTFRGDSWWSAHPANVVAWRERSRTLEGVGWAQPATRSLLAGGEPIVVGIQRVSAELTDVLGIEPTVGRPFERSHEVPGSPPVVLLGDALWRDLGEPEMGESVVMDGTPHTVLGVLPPSWDGGVLEPHDAVVPRVFTEEELRSPGRVLRTVGRLEQGVSPDEAARELGRIVRDVDVGADGWGVDLVPLRERLVGDVRPTLLLLLGAVSFVLLVAVVNVGNLLLARSTARSGELATRAVLGAGRGRLLRQLGVEAVILGLLGGGAGLLLAHSGSRALLALAPGVLPRAAGMGPGLPVLAFAAGLSLLVGLACAVIPAGRSLRAPGPTLVASSSRTLGGPADRLRYGLVAAEVALVVLLLVGAGLALRGFDRLRDVDAGFPLEDRLVVELTLPDATHPTNAEVARFFERLLERVRSLPGVEAAGAVSHPPLSGDDWSSYHIVESRPPEEGEEPIGAMEIAGPGYFEALGVPLLEGRGFRSADLEGGHPVAIVDDRMAELYWPDRSPLGDRIRPSRGGEGAVWHEVVGVVGAIRYELGGPPRPRLYLPDGATGPDHPTRHLVIRSSPGLAATLRVPVREVVREVAPDLAVSSMRTMEASASASITRVRLRTLLMGTFGAIGLLLGAVGVYGMVSYAASRRRREVGLRMALGAGRARVLTRILVDALLPVAIGVIAGTLLAWGTGPVFEAVLVEPGVGGPWLFLTVASVLLVVALAAALGPGVRATRVDPVEALRAE